LAGPADPSEKNACTQVAEWRSPFVINYPQGDQVRPYSELQSAMQDNSLLFQLALKQVSRRRKPPSGSVALAIALLPDGEVAAVKIEDGTLQDEALHQKLLRIVEVMNFGPAPGGGYCVFLYPMFFG